MARLSGLALSEIQRRKLSLEEEQPLCHGQPAGIGVAAGPLVLDVEAARRCSADGRPAVLVREEMVTADIAGIALSAGVLTARGNLTSHAAVVARQLGKACVTGCGTLRIDQARRVITFGERSLAEGELLTLDSNTGLVFAGEVSVIVEYPTQWLVEVENWRQEQT